MNEIGDIGEIWFGKATERRMIDWLVKNIDKPADLRLMDLGCGNAHLLCQLHQKGFRRLIGVDYSTAAVDLARRVCADAVASIDIQQADILSDEFTHEWSQDLQFDFVLDKGTLDAISLSAAENGSPHQRDCQVTERYAKNVSLIIKPMGHLMITSCNWTEDELREIMQSHFHPTGRIQHPTVQFGGKVGQTVSTVIFQRLLSI